MNIFFGFEQANEREFNEFFVDEVENEANKWLNFKRLKFLAKISTENPLRTFFDKISTSRNFYCHSHWNMRFIKIKSWHPLHMILLFTEFLLFTIHLNIACFVISINHDAKIYVWRKGEESAQKKRDCKFLFSLATSLGCFTLCRQQETRIFIFLFFSLEIGSADIQMRFFFFVTNFSSADIF